MWTKIRMTPQTWTYGDRLDGLLDVCSEKTQDLALRGIVESNRQVNIAMTRIYIPPLHAERIEFSRLPCLLAMRDRHYS